jgi:hypothetical protein
MRIEDEPIIGYVTFYDNKKENHLYVVIKRWRKTSIIALAMFIPRQVLPPIPKAKKLYGFDSSCPRQKHKKKKKNTSKN